MAKTIFSPSSEQKDSQLQLKTTTKPLEEEPQADATTLEQERGDFIDREVQVDGPDSKKETKEEHKDFLETLLEQICCENWSQVRELLERDPSLSKREVTMVVQGENTKCLPVHLLCGQAGVPVSVIDTIVTLHPASLLVRDSRGSRLPIHIAMIVQQDPSLELISYLCKARPQALLIKDQEGNLPLHYAALCGSPSSLHWLLEADVDACRVANTRERFPLHLIAARCFDTKSTHFISLSDVERAIQAFPQALLAVDRFGRTPLHLAANLHHSVGAKGKSRPPPHRWQLLQKLIDHASEALLMKDKAGKTPLQCAMNIPKGSKKKFNKKNDVVISSLMESTYQERKRQRGSSLFGRLIYGQQQSSSSSLLESKEFSSSNSSLPSSDVDEDLYCCYG